MSALPIRLHRAMQQDPSGDSGGAANAWLLQHHHEIVSRAGAIFARLDPDRREEAVAEVTARAVAWAHSAARRGRLHVVTPYWLVVYASRQYRQGRRFTGDNCRCALSPLARIRHGVTVLSLDEEHVGGDSRPRRLRDCLANRNAESPFEACRRAIDYPGIFAAESVSQKALATFDFLLQTKSQGRLGDLAAELHVSSGRVTQLKGELAEALARHDYLPPLRSRTSPAAG